MAHTTDAEEFNGQRPGAPVAVDMKAPRAHLHTAIASMKGVI